MLYPHVFCFGQTSSCRCHVWASQGITRGRLSGQHGSGKGSIVVRWRLHWGQWRTVHVAECVTDRRRADAAFLQHANNTKTPHLNLAHRAALLSPQASSLPHPLPTPVAMAARRTEELRSLLRQKREQKKAQGERVVHRLAGYNDSGDLMCKVCRIKVGVGAAVRIRVITVMLGWLA